MRGERCVVSDGGEPAQRDAACLQSATQRAVSEARRLPPWLLPAGVGEEEVQLAEEVGEEAAGLLHARGGGGGVVASSPRRCRCSCSKPSSLAASSMEHEICVRTEKIRKER
jgi:hypothetical protein